MSNQTSIEVIRANYPNHDISDMIELLGIEVFEDYSISFEDFERIVNVVEDLEEQR